MFLSLWCSTRQKGAENCEFLVQCIWRCAQVRALDEALLPQACRPKHVSIGPFAVHCCLRVVSVTYC